MVKNANQLDKLLNDKKGVLDGVRFAVPPSKINKLNIIINKISKKYKNISFNVNLMYLSKWIYNEKILDKSLKNISKNINIISFVDSYGALVPEQIKEFLFKVKIEIFLKRKSVPIFIIIVV